jgi:Holliday junction DNA helicase RuvA
MISYIEGEIIMQGANFIILKAGGVGFKIFVLPDTDVSVDRIGLYTHMAVREDAMTLFGFNTYEELELFEILIAVSGVGPKAGMGILSIANPNTIKLAIAKEDASILTRVSGIGKKTAERVILELKNRFTLADIKGGELNSTQKEIMEQQDVIEALMGLGYGQNEVRQVLSNIPREKSLEERIKLALKELGKKK